MSFDKRLTPGQLVNDVFLGDGAKAGNISFSGSNNAVAYFYDREQMTGLQEGIFMTTGDVDLARGPNKSQFKGNFNYMAGDELLESIAHGKTYDAAVLEFDFVTASENLMFEFVFCSEEYDEYVGSKYNDVFGFFVNREGSEELINLARLPDGETPITINTVNSKTNKKYYVDNNFVNVYDMVIWEEREKKYVRNKMYGKREKPSPYNLQYDGFTTVLTATLKVIPHEKYHIKISIADVADGIYDSGVFLKARSFRSEGEVIASVDDFFPESEPAPRHEELTMEKEEELLASRKKRQQGNSEKEMMKNEALEKTNEHTASREMTFDWPDSLTRVLFEFDKFDISPEAAALLQAVIEVLKEEEYLYVDIRGHTDSEGTNTYNMVLSENRSVTVARMLVENGIDPERLSISYYGEEKPLVANDDGQSRALNRRVEIFFKVPIE